jgi:hypothetical protein
MEKIPLSLSENHTDRPSASEQVEESTPLSGYLAVGFGMLGLLFSLIALLRGQGAWGFVGLLLAIGGILSSPIFMGIIGLGAIYMTFDWQEMLQPLYEMIGNGKDV